MIKEFEFFFSDLTPEAQERFMEFLGGDNGNYDVLPFCIFEQESFEQESEE